MLEELLIADGGVVSAEELLERVWDEHADPFSRTVTVTMAGCGASSASPTPSRPWSAPGTGCDEPAIGLPSGGSWPQRVRTRLALLYAALFLAAGSALLGLTYGLVAAACPRLSATSAARLRKTSSITLHARPASSRDPEHRPRSRHCKQAFTAGATTGASQRAPAHPAEPAAVLPGRPGGDDGRLGRPGLVRLPAGCCGRSRAITETARRASDQHLGERLALRGPGDELKELADTFDDMLERLDARLRRAAPVRRRRLARAAHPADRDADRHRRRAGQAEQDHPAAGGHGRHGSAGPSTGPRP